MLYSILIHITLFALNKVEENGVGSGALQNAFGEKC